VTIDRELMDAADLLPYGQLDIWNCRNGNRLSTYVIEGEPGQRQICINGAATHLMKPGDLVIIANWADMDDGESRCFEARWVFVDHENRIRD